MKAEFTLHVVVMVMVMMVMRVLVVMLRGVRRTGKYQQQ